MNCVIDQSFLHSHNRHYHHYRHVHRRQVGLHLHDQSQATETMPHIHINTPKDCSKPKSIYQAFLLSMYFCDPNIDAPGGICKPKSMCQTGSGALIFWRRALSSGRITDPNTLEFGPVGKWGCHSIGPKRAVWKCWWNTHCCTLRISSTDCILLLETFAPVQDQCSLRT